MGGRAYLARLALGRSAYEPFRSEESSRIPHRQAQSAPEPISLPSRNTDSLESQDLRIDPCVQQFDQNGQPLNPVSRALSRRSRRAQNDVLAIAGIVAGPKSSPTDSLTAVEIQRQLETSNESDAGTWISVAGWVTAAYVHSRMNIMRHRLQTFRFYAGVPFPFILGIERRSSGLSFLLLAGLPGGLGLLEPGMLWVHRVHRTVRRLFSKSMVPESLYAKSPGLRYFLELCGAVVNICVETACFSALTALQLTSILQGLGTLPLGHFYPTANTLVHLMTVSFMIPSRSGSNFTPRSGLAGPITVATSPVVLCYILAYARNAIASKVSDYVQLALPRPDNPDLHSIVVVATRKEVDLQSRQLELPVDRVNGEPALNSRTVWEQARIDGAALRDYLYSIASWSRPVATRLRYSGSYSDEVEDQERKSIMMESSEHSPEDQAAERDDSESNASAENELDSSNSRPERAAGLREPTASLNGVRNSTEGSSSVGLDNGSIVHDKSKASHRVTKLSQCLAENMTISVSSMVADIILLPLETLLVRSVAITYLTTPGLSPTSSHWIREQIYPTRSWFGMGLRGGRAMDYARKMALCFVMEMVLGYGVWQIGAGVTWGVGKWFFNWGRL